MTLDGHEILARFWPSRKTHAKVWMAAGTSGSPNGGRTLAGAGSARELGAATPGLDRVHGPLHHPHPMPSSPLTPSANFGHNSSESDLIHHMFAFAGEAASAITALGRSVCTRGAIRPASKPVSVCSAAGAASSP